jgi:hypothetical protein
VEQDRLLELHNFVRELSALINTYGFELSEVGEGGGGIMVYDQEHDTILAHNLTFDDDESDYRFNVFWNGQFEPVTPPESP